MTRTLEAGLQARATSAVFHGLHPLRGYPVTWHLTPLSRREHRVADFLVERADGHIEDPDVWDLAEKDVVVMDAHEMGELVRRASTGVRH